MNEQFTSNNVEGNHKKTKKYNRRAESPLAIAEKKVIEQYITGCNGNILKCAKLLQLNRNTLRNLIDIHEIDLKAIRKRSKGSNLNVQQQQ